MINHKERLLEDFKEKLKSLATDPLYMLGGSITLQHSDTERFLVVRSVMAFGVVKYVIKRINARGQEGSGIYYEFNDLSGVTEGVNVYLDEPPVLTIVPERMKPALEKARESLHWKLADLSGLFVSE